MLTLGAIAYVKRVLTRLPIARNFCIALRVRIRQHAEVSPRSINHESRLPSALNAQPQVRKCLCHLHNMVRRGGNIATVAAFFSPRCTTNNEGVWIEIGSNSDNRCLSQRSSCDSQTYRQRYGNNQPIYTRLHIILFQLFPKRF